jgi:hypothetical protein
MRIYFFQPNHFLAVVVAGYSFCLSACAPGRGSRTDWGALNFHNVVIVCLQANPSVNRRVESQMVPLLLHQGLAAVGSQDLFPAVSKYSPKGLMDQMRRARVDGIMELQYSGEIPAQGLPQGIRFKYHSIKGQSAKLSDRLGTLDEALTALIVGPGR